MGAAGCLIAGFSQMPSLESCACLELRLSSVASCCQPVLLGVLSAELCVPMQDLRETDILNMLFYGTQRDEGGGPQPRRSW